MHSSHLQLASVCLGAVCVVMSHVDVTFLSLFCSPIHSFNIVVNLPFYHTIYNDEMTFLIEHLKTIPTSLIQLKLPNKHI